ncbi:uncharacterized protein LOC143458822 [Clavelina lepadiformis]|uniref:uncharacterized protein LOC143458822 n=1 Tax=Clavelina lepadiformis TaxID=159417 RepID=UPI004041E6CE
MDQDMSFRFLIQKLAEGLTDENIQMMQYLCMDAIPRGMNLKTAIDFFGYFETKGWINHVDMSFLAEVLYRINRHDLLKKLPGVKNRRDYEENYLMSQNNQNFTPFRVACFHLIEELTKSDFYTLKNLCRNKLSARNYQRSSDIMSLLICLEEEDYMSDGDLDFMLQNLRHLDNQTPYQIFQRLSQGDTTITLPKRHQSSSSLSTSKPLPFGGMGHSQSLPQFRSDYVQGPSTSYLSMQPAVYNHGIHNYDQQQFQASSNLTGFALKNADYQPDGKLFVEVSNRAFSNIESSAKTWQTTYEDEQCANAYHPFTAYQPRGPNSNLNSQAYQTGLPYPSNRAYQPCDPNLNPSCQVPCDDWLDDQTDAKTLQPGSNKLPAPRAQPVEMSEPAVNIMRSFEEMQIVPDDSRQSPSVEISSELYDVDSCGYHPTNADMPKNETSIEDHGISVCCADGGDSSVECTSDNFEGLESYLMDRRPVGLCLIINNYCFEDAFDQHEAERRMNLRGNSLPVPNVGLKDRSGSRKDVERIQELFESFGFEVDVESNLDSRNLKKIVREYARKSYIDYDCLVVFVMSHGLEGSVYGIDGFPVHCTWIHKCFRPQSTPSLLDKPKMFFFQACQGDNRMSGHYFTPAPACEDDIDIETEAIESDSAHTVIATPVEADFLIGHSTVPGYLSYRDKQEGSWYIETLIKNLEKYHEKEDLLSILVKVNHEMSSKPFKQMPMPIATLRKKIYFRKMSNSATIAKALNNETEYE